MSTTPILSDIRNSPDNQTVLSDLGLLAELAGTWEGDGFNLIARPDFVQGTNLFLQLSDTREILKFEPIGSPIPNRTFGPNPNPNQPFQDLKLAGLTYLQKIHDAQSGGALHIEPGMWVRQPNTNYPPETAPKGQELIFRLGTIPHGNSLLAQGIASKFDGDPVLQASSVLYNGSVFPSFNSTPFPIPPAPASPILNAAGSSEALSAPTPPGPPGFTQYDLGTPASATNTRTSPLPPGVNQTVVDDPITLLQNVITDQKKSGHSFSGTVLNIATQAQVTFFTNPNSKPGAATTPVNVPNGAGGIENILFLLGEDAVKSNGPNAQTALVYATFWIEKVTHPTDPTFMQLQYAQMVILNFEILKALPNAHVLIGWPHISVATLRKTFN
jgi:hypothetical protein